MDIKDVDLLSLLPLFMRRDDTSRAIAAALQPTVRSLGGQTRNALILPRLDELDGGIIDELAWERHVDFYDASLPIEIRRELVRRSNEFHWYKGTPYAVQTMVDTLMANAEVIEWFRDGGEPYTFSINVAGGLKEPHIVPLVYEAVNKVKNKRSWLRTINFNIKRDIIVSVGSQSVFTKTRTYPALPYDNVKQLDADITIASKISSHRKYIRAPAPYLNSKKLMCSLGIACARGIYRYRRYPAAFALEE